MKLSDFEVMRKTHIFFLQSGYEHRCEQCDLKMDYDPIIYGP